MAGPCWAITPALVVEAEQKEQSWHGRQALRAREWITQAFAKLLIQSVL